MNFLYWFEYNLCNLYIFCLCYIFFKKGSNFCEVNLQVKFTFMKRLKRFKILIFFGLL